jgi:hypothetical protein
MLKGGCGKQYRPEVHFTPCLLSSRGSCQNSTQRNQEFDISTMHILKFCFHSPLLNQIAGIFLFVTFHPNPPPRNSQY